MRRLILVFLLIAVLAGVGFAAWFFLAPTTEETAEPAPDLPPVITFVTMPPLMVSMMGPDRPEQFVTLRLALEVDDVDNAGRVQAQQQRLTNALIETMYAALSDASVVNGAIVNLAALKQRLQRTCDRVVGRGTVRGVLIQGITQRQL